MDFTIIPSLTMFIKQSFKMEATSNGTLVEERIERKHLYGRKHGKRFYFKAPMKHHIFCFAVFSGLQKSGSIMLSITRCIAVGIAPHCQLRGWRLQQAKLLPKANCKMPG